MAREIKGEEVVGTRIIRNLLAGNSVPEAQMAYKSVAALRGARGTAYNAGRQIDPIGRNFDLTSRNWQPRQLGRDQKALATIKAIRDIDAQASQAVWNFLRLVNPGMTLTAMQGSEGLDEKEEQGPAQAYLDELMKRVGSEYGGGGDQFHNVLTLSLITDGAVACEVAPTEDLGDVEDWYPVEPLLVSFRRDPETHRLLMGQRFRDGTFADLNAEQVFYVPLDPDVEDPYGRPPLLPAVSAVVRKMQVLNDVQAAAHNAGYPRIDVEVAYEALLEHAPAELKTMEKAPELIAWAEKQLETLVSEYESMQVDDTFVHYDWVRIKPLQGAGSFDVGPLEKVLTSQVNSALKSLPILLGVHQGGNEGYGSVQWNIQIATVEALQRIIKRVIEKLANVSLALAGFQAHARAEYDKTRTVDRLTEAQAETFEMSNLKTSVAMGWRDNAEASDLAVGHPPVADPMPGALGLRPPGSVGEGGGLEQWPSTVDLTSEQEELSKSVDYGATKAPWDLLQMTSAPVDVPPPTRMADDQTHGADADLEELIERSAGRYVTRARNACEAWAPIVAVAGDWLPYRRDLLALLRDAVREGMEARGATVRADEDIVRAIWLEHADATHRLEDDTVGAAPGDIEWWMIANAGVEGELGGKLGAAGLRAGYRARPGHVATARPDAP